MQIDGLEITLLKGSEIACAIHGSRRDSSWKIKIWLFLTLHIQAASESGPNISIEAIPQHEAKPLLKDSLHSVFKMCGFLTLHNFLIWKDHW